VVRVGEGGVWCKGWGWRRCCRVGWGWWRLVWAVGFGVGGRVGAARGVRRVQRYVLDDWHFIAV
jgi:hypothetical protein